MTKKKQIDVNKTIDEVSKAIAEFKDPKTKELMQKYVTDTIKNPKLSEVEKWLRIRATILLDKECGKIVQEIEDKKASEFDIENAIADFEETQALPKTTIEERQKVLAIGRENVLELRRRLETEKNGEDPDPKIVGYGENGETIVEAYKICLNCKTCFKSFKNEWFCQPSCREIWVSKNQNDRPFVQEEFAELNNESWDWERVGNGKFKRVWKND